MVANVNEPEKLLEASYFVDATTMMGFQWLCIARNRKKYVNLLRFFQENINESDDFSLL